MEIAYNMGREEQHGRRPKYRVLPSRKKGQKEKVDGDFGLVKATVCYFVGGAPKGEIESHVEGYWGVGYLEMADMNDESGKTRQAKLCGRSDFVRSLMNN